MGPHLHAVKAHWNRFGEEEGGGGRGKLSRARYYPDLPLFAGFEKLENIAVINEEKGKFCSNPKAHSHSVFSHLLARPRKKERA